MSLDNSKLLHQGPDDLNHVVLREALRELGRMLDGLSRDEEGAEIIDLLAEMVRDGAVGFRWDAVDDQPIRIWYALTDKPYTDRLSGIRNDVAASVVELFLCGDVVFAILPSSPKTVSWRRNSMIA
jgi:hypothetical protein